MERGGGREKRIKSTPRVNSEKSCKENQMYTTFPCYKIRKHKKNLNLKACYYGVSWNSLLSEPSTKSSLAEFFFFFLFFFLILAWGECIVQADTYEPVFVFTLLPYINQH